MLFEDLDCARSSEYALRLRSGFNVTRPSRRRGLMYNQIPSAVEGRSMNIERSRDVLSMALEVIKRFFAIIALIQCFASGRTKLADHSCVIRVAMWALNAFFLLKQIGRTNHLFWIGRCNSICLQFFFSMLGHPICSPGR